MTLVQKSDGYMKAALTRNNGHPLAQPVLTCANCAIEFDWTPVDQHGLTYCCSGCADGGPCSCEYDAPVAFTASTTLEEASRSIMAKSAKNDDATSSSGKIRPIGDRIVIKPVAREEITKSGIYLPDTSKEKPQEGVVVAVGSGRLLDNGDRATMEIHVGDKVLFAKYGGTEFKYDGEDMLVLRESDVLAILAE